MMKTKKRRKSKLRKKTTPRVAEPERPEAVSKY